MAGPWGEDDPKESLVIYPPRAEISSRDCRLDSEVVLHDAKRGNISYLTRARWKVDAASLSEGGAKVGVSGEARWSSGERRCGGDVEMCML